MNTPTPFDNVKPVAIIAPNNTSNHIDKKIITSFSKYCAHVNWIPGRHARCDNYGNFVHVYRKYGADRVASTIKEYRKMFDARTFVTHASFPLQHTVAFYHACKMGCFDVMEMIYTLWPHQEYFTQYNTHSFDISCTNGHNTIAKWLLYQWQADPQLLNHACYYAARECNTELLEWICASQYARHVKAPQHYLQISIK